MLVVSLVTLGSPSQLTGGYLYHQRVAEAAGAHDAEVRFVSFPAAGFPLPAVWASSVMRRARRADVVVVDSIAAAFVAPALLVSSGLPPLVASVHQVPGGIDHGPVRSRIQAPLDRFLYRRAARVIAASDALAADLVAEGLDRVRVAVVPPGCDVAPFDGAAPDLRRGRSAAFVCVGNWVARKGILELVEAFARLPPEAATLHLVGRVDVSPAYAGAVRQRLGAADLSGRVVVHGPVARTEVARLLAGADAFVLPSLREPYGTVYGEALAAGVPVVGWRAGNLPHLAEDGREGVIVSPGDVEGLAAGLLRLATDDAFRARLRAGAEARGRSLPRWEESVARFFGVLREVAGAAR